MEEQQKKYFLPFLRHLKKWKKIIWPNQGWERECFSYLTAVSFFRKKLYLRFLNVPQISDTGPSFSQRLGVEKIMFSSDSFGGGIVQEIRKWKCKYIKNEIKILKKYLWRSSSIKIHLECIKGSLPQRMPFYHKCVPISKKSQKLLCIYFLYIFIHFCSAFV